MPPKAKGKRQRETVKPISGLDVDALLGGEKKESISPENAIPDFKRALNSSEEVEQIADATKQMGAIVQSLITDSFGDNKYAQAMESIGVMREELINLEEPGQYNEFVRDLKKKLLSGTLGGDRRDFWFKMRWAKLGLIIQSQSEASTVTLEEADEVSSAADCQSGDCCLLICGTVLQVEVKIEGQKCHVFSQGSQVQDKYGIV